ncbi:permease [Streptomyces sp. LP05-1]|uniref:Permease n=1 Tax=Streptomyces pyxinae TaxID=2970734 RepID=A0ABT2CJ30_9ACTN|nr:solute carrier family 23 protein [Streptomyces sp. LP05-1]MCS0637430.1 permease [Streptomyces sp. LP05-1]
MAAVRHLPAVTGTPGPERPASPARGRTPQGRGTDDSGRQPPAGVTATGAAADPVDELPPPRRLLPLAAQHVLAMFAAPVSTTFLTAGTLHLSGPRTATLLGVTLVLCGAGTLLQSLGAWGIGARLPFVMLPGGAATALFLAVADEHGAATASGSVILAALVLLAVVPFYARVVRLFPPLVMGVTVVLIGVSMVRAAAGLIAGPAGRPPLSALALAAVTMGCTLAAHLLLRGIWRQASVLLGMAAGTVAAVACGLGALTPLARVPAELPRIAPYGAPHFDVLAALPLLVFSLTSLAEATGQTVLNSETVGRVPRPGRDVPRVLRADAVVSLLAGAFGLAPMVTSAENIGISNLSGVRSRFVTAAAGVLLVACGLAAPLSRWLAAIPPAVVGGGALTVYGVITVMGIRMLHRADLDDRVSGTVAATALTVGLLPIVSPTLYAEAPQWVRSTLGNAVVSGTVAAVLLHALSRLPRPRGRSAAPAAAGPAAGGREPRR